MARLAFSPKAIKSRVDNFVVAQNRAKRILSTAVHNQRLRIQQLEQYQRDLLNDEREHAEQLRQDAAAKHSDNASNEVLTDFEGQSEGYSPRNASSGSKPCTTHIIASCLSVRSRMASAKTAFSIREIERYATRTDRMWKDTSD
jgi:hypothetical protein